MAEAAGRGGAAIAVLAQGLVGLRDNAGGPDGAELEAETGLGARIVADALGGEKLPALPVTLALVAAWGGDVEAWEGYWNQIADLVAAEEVKKTSVVAEADAKASGSAPGKVKGGAQAGAADVTASAEDNSRSSEAASAGEGESGSRAASDLAPAGEAKADAQKAGAPVEAALLVPQPPALVPAPEPVEQADQAEEAATAELVAAKAESIPPAKPPKPPKPPKPAKAAAAEPRPDAAHPRRRAHRVFVALVILIAAGGGVLSYALTRSDDSSGSSKAAPRPTGVASPSHAGTPSGAASPSRFASPTPTFTPTPTPSQQTFPSPTPTFDTSSTPTAASTNTASHVPGTLLGLYPKVQLPSGYSADFLNDTFHPIPGSTLGGDTLGLAATGPAEGRFVAAQAVLFDADEPGTFERCLNDTRYQQDVSLAALSVGSLFCVHGPSGELVLVKIDRLPQPQDANPYVMIDLTIWQGR